MNLKIIWNISSILCLAPLSGRIDAKSLFLRNFHQLFFSFCLLYSLNVLLARTNLLLSIFVQRSSHCPAIEIHRSFQIACLHESSSYFHVSGYNKSTFVYQIAVSAFACFMQKTQPTASFPPSLWENFRGSVSHICRSCVDVCTPNTTGTRIFVINLN